MLKHSPKWYPVITLFVTILFGVPQQPYTLTSIAINANLASVSENKDHVDSTVGERWGGGGDDGEEEWGGGVRKGQFVFHLTCAVCTDSTPGPPFLLSPSFPPTCSFNLSSLTTSPIKIGQLLHKHWRSGGDGCEEQERECGGWEKELLETDGYAERR